MEVVAPDDDLVVVGEQTPVDALAVHEHPVEAAIVEDVEAARPVDDQRVPTRHGGIVEPDLRRGASPDPRPRLAQPERDTLAAGGRWAMYWPGTLRSRRNSSIQDGTPSPTGTVGAIATVSGSANSDDRTNWVP